MFYSDNLLLSVLARSCKESVVAVADAYNISVFDLSQLDSSCFKNVFWDYFTSILLLFICNGVFGIFSTSFYLPVCCVCF